MRKVAEVPTGLMPAVTSRLKIMGELDIADRRNARTAASRSATTADPVDLRIAVLPTTFGEKVVLGSCTAPPGGSASPISACNPEPRRC
jgi:type II secretory ATPase GspE/PulE/Tfp pilus assembly ATPase PilB-like protein